MGSDIIAKLDDWKKRFYDEQNRKAIWNQLYGMFYEDAVFRIFVEEYNRKVVKAKERKDLFRGIVGQSFVSSWGRSQCSYIRALKDGSRTNKDQKPNSLLKIYLEIKKNACFLTREVYFEWLGVCYEETEADRKRHEILRSSLNNPMAVIIPNDACPENTRCIHSRFDKISNVKNEDKRLRQDSVSKDFLGERIKKDLLKSLEEIHVHTTKAIAHNDIMHKITPPIMKEIREAHEALCSYASVVIEVLFPFGLLDTLLTEELFPGDIRAFEVCFGIENGDWIQDFWKENVQRINAWLGITVQNPRT